MAKKDDTLTVIPVGSTVTVGDKIEARVRSITIGPGNTVFYTIAFWSGNSLTTDDFHEDEVSATNTTTQQIGFNR